MEYLPSYKELKNQFPLSNAHRISIEHNRNTIKKILSGHDSRLLLIVGPCSLHDSISAKDFATQFKKLSAAVSSQFFLVMRAYCEKPRTAGGWKGFLYDPYLDGSNNMQTGIYWSRQLLLELVNMQIPLATEFLDPMTAFYYEDLISWGSIGARTSSSQPHRQLASALHMPIGIKNGVAGNISAAVNGVISSTHSHVFMGLSEDGNPCIIRSKGNPDAHIVLRGGDTGPNYDPNSVSIALQKLRLAQLPECVVIDCAHKNSDKNYDRQSFVLQSILNQFVEGNLSIRGLMLESHLYSGSQCLLGGSSSLKYGISITDPCLDWHSTEQLITQGANYLAENQSTDEQTILNNRITRTLAN
ncbi:MAG: 3-deoxy-7-phosphoheptulonate synthase [Parachlamydiaceae bacterium]|nr:3-deoxy-7-phosphoheptulonate synthase [Parachlamydiaceae bacterium]